MAKLKVLWRVVTDHEAIVEIDDETYDGSDAQHDEILKKCEEEAPSGTAVDSRGEIVEVETLRKGTEVPAINRPIYTPEF